MNRAEQILAMTPEQRYEARIRFAYKWQRRKFGAKRGADALQKAQAQVARLSGMVAVMDASDWKANPIDVARNAAFA